MSYKIFKVRKKSGSYRTIYAPDKLTKARLRECLPALADQARLLDVHGVQHGFSVNRSVVTNALAHVDWDYSMTFDLSDFFDSVKPGMVGFKTSHKCFVEGAARQGLPTSPTLANIAASPMDSEIVELNRHGRFGTLFAYTRYADDLSFSFNHPWIAFLLRKHVPEIAARHGFQVNAEKTHWMSARAGRRTITGVAVDKDGVHPTRESKRRLRAALHQKATGKICGRTLAKLLARKRKGATLAGMLCGQARGLVEWVKLKLPKGFLLVTGRGADRNKNNNNLPGGRVAPTQGELRGVGQPQRFGRLLRKFALC